MATPSVIVSAFLDEGVPVEDNKNLTQQLLVGQALGLKYWTPRFVFDETTGAIGKRNIPKNRSVRYIFKV